MYYRIAEKLSKEQESLLNVLEFKKLDKSKTYLKSYDWGRGTYYTMQFTLDEDNSLVLYMSFNGQENAWSEDDYYEFYLRDSKEIDECITESIKILANLQSDLRILKKFKIISEYGY